MKNLDILVDLQYYSTNTINEEMSNNKTFAKDIQHAIKEFCAGRWGEVPKEDKEANNHDLETLTGRVVARYKTSVKDIYIITEDFTSATILFCDEY